MAASADERRIASVLLVDLAGSSAIAERLGPERSMIRVMETEETNRPLRRICM
jgi:hypothetical protein